MSCFACKIKGGRKGVCSYPDDLQPILEKAIEVDAIICGSPVYCGYPTANLRAFMERIIFPADNYSDFQHPIINKGKRSATIYTMNCPDMQTYKNNAYDILMDVNAHQLGMFGPTEILYSFDTYQFNDYSRYDAAQLNVERKTEMHNTQFPKDLERAFDLGKRLAQEQ